MLQIRDSGPTPVMDGKDGDGWITHLSLFSGYEGFGLGFRLAGLPIRTIGYVEIDEYCQRLIQARIRDGLLDWAPIVRDIRRADFRRLAGLVGLITAGFPCQPHSAAGLRAGASDDRNLWPETAGAIRDVGPRWVLLENVPGILANRYAGTVAGELASLGYDSIGDRVPAAAVGAPHLRWRWFCLSGAAGLGRPGRGRPSEPGDEREEMERGQFRWARWRGKDCGRRRRCMGTTTGRGFRRRAGTGCRQRSGFGRPLGPATGRKARILITKTGGDIPQPSRRRSGCGRRPRPTTRGPETRRGWRGRRPSATGAYRDLNDEAARWPTPVAHGCRAPESGLSEGESDTLGGGADGLPPTGYPAAEARAGSPGGVAESPFGIGASHGLGIGIDEWWAIEPALGRVADGTADRVDQLRALGNGIVPAVVRKFLRGR